MKKSELIKLIREVIDEQRISPVKRPNGFKPSTSPAGPKKRPRPNTSPVGGNPNPQIGGCTDEEANNYNENATYDDGSCDYDLAPDPDPDFFTNTFCCGPNQLPSGGVAQGTPCYTYLGQLAGYATSPCGSGGGGFGGGGFGGFGGFGGIDF